ncbi:MAG TPA: hypothetical protein VN516_00010 [Candidatus Baltobacteraceae bacterium]|nr:hypothetical protein [Candidatus Baltobacteraceae bacterium]
MHKLILNSCAFILLSMCHSAKANTALLILNAGLSSADTVTTYSEKRQLGDGWYEKDRVTRPFVSSLPESANLALAIGGDALLADIGLKMRRSNHWYRRIWWLPQVAVAAGNAWGVTNNIELQRAR